MFSFVIIKTKKVSSFVLETSFSICLLSLVFSARNDRVTLFFSAKLLRHPTWWNRIDMDMFGFFVNQSVQ